MSIEDDHDEVLALENTRLKAEVQLLQETLAQLGESTDEGIGTNYEEVQVARHTHFDDSIRHYFDLSEQMYYNETLEQNHTPTLNILENELQDLKYNILYENLFRLGGVTAFPLNQRLLGKHGNDNVNVNVNVKDNDDVNDTSDNNYLGLRFDIFSTTTRKFLTPHYVILRKVPTESKLAGQLETAEPTGDSGMWSVYRHTLPVFVPLDEYEKQLQLGSKNEDRKQALSRFARQIRAYLLHLNYKHDKFDLLKKLTFSDFGFDTHEPLVTALDKDLQCCHVKVTFSSLFRTTIELVLVCNQLAIESATLSTANNELLQSDKLVCEGILRNSPLKDLVKCFRKVSELLLRKHIKW